MIIFINSTIGKSTSIANNSDNRNRNRNIQCYRKKQKFKDKTLKIARKVYSMKNFHYTDKRS